MSRGPAYAARVRRHRSIARISRSGSAAECKSDGAKMPAGGKPGSYEPILMLSCCHCSPCMRPRNADAYAAVSANGADGNRWSHRHRCPAPPRRR